MFYKNNPIKNRSEAIIFLKEKYFESENISNNASSPFDSILAISENQDFIDNLFESYVNGIESMGKLPSMGKLLPSQTIIHKDREKGKIVSVEDYTIDKVIEGSFDMIYSKSSIFYNTPFKTQLLSDLIEQDISKRLAKSKKLFLLYLSELKSKNDYINENINTLCDTLNNFSESLKSCREFDKKYYLILIDKVKETLKNLVFDYFELLTPTTRKRLKQLLPTLAAFLDEKRKICSFDFKKKDIIVGFKNHLINNGLIDDIENAHFNKVFFNQPVSKRINWKEDKGLFYYFINQLIKQEVVDSTNMRWKRAANSFTIKHQDIDYKKICRQKKSKKVSIIKKIDRIINQYSNKK